jgi:hypothetical protein
MLVPGYDRPSPQMRIGEDGGQSLREVFKRDGSILSRVDGKQGANRRDEYRSFERTC